MAASKKVRADPIRESYYTPKAAGCNLLVCERRPVVRRSLIASCYSPLIARARSASLHSWKKSTRRSSRSARGVRRTADAMTAPDAATSMSSSTLIPLCARPAAASIASCSTRSSRWACPHLAPTRSRPSTRAATRWQRRPGWRATARRTPRCRPRATPRRSAASSSKSISRSAGTRTRPPLPLRRQPRPRSP